ncbi:MAG: hypothetical protein ACXW1D_00245 [Halobacteriota archaeon]
MNKTRHEGIAFENYVARYYTSKVQNCATEGKEFTLTLPEVRRMLGQKVCSYTGLPLTHSNVGTNSGSRYSDVTLDRIDNSKGYIKGNVKAVAKGINELKSIAENPSNELSLKHLDKMSKSLNKLMKGIKK